jgi:hypothetical protein
MSSVLIEQEERYAHRGAASDEEKQGDLQIHGWGCLARLIGEYEKQIRCRTKSNKIE